MAVGVVAAALLWGPYPATALHVVDGDTVDVQATVYPGIHVEERVRFANADAPEMDGQCEQEKRLARVVKRRLEELLADGFTVSVEEDVSFNRRIGTVYVNEEPVGDILVEEGMARTDGHYRDGYWCLHTLPP